MTEFKQGQKVRALRATRSWGGQSFRTDDILTLGEQALASAELVGDGFALVAGPADHPDRYCVRPADWTVVPEPETEIVPIRRARDFRAGDVVMVASHPEDDAAVSLITVRREKAPEPPKPEPGTFGTAVVGGQRVRGFLDQDRDFVYWSHLGVMGRTTRPGNWTDFEPETTPDAPPALPTREALAEAIQRKGAFHEAARPGRPETELWRVSPLRAADRVLDLLKEAR